MATKHKELERPRGRGREVQGRSATSTHGRVTHIQGETTHYSSSVGRQSSETAVIVQGQKEHLILEPQWSELINLTAPIAASWKELGTQLKLQSGILEEIEADNRKAMARMSNALVQWHQSNPKGSWEDIVAALKRMKENRLAETIREKHCQDMYSTSTHDQGETTHYSSSMDRESSETAVIVQGQKEHLILDSQWSEFMNLMDPVASSWRQLGTHLKLQPHALKQIKANNRDDSWACLNATLGEWHQSNPKASWEDIVAALEWMEENCLAETIREKHCQDMYCEQQADRHGNGLPLSEEGNREEGDHTSGDDTTTTGVSVQGQIGYQNDHEREHSFGSSQKPPYQMQQPSRLWDGSGNASYQGGEWPPKTGGDHTSGDDTTGVSVHGQIGYQNDHEREHSFGSSQKPPYQMQQPSRLWDGSGNGSYQGGEWPPKTGGDHTSGDDTTGVSVHGQIGYQNDHEREHSFGSSQKPPYQMQQPSRLWDGSGNGSYQGGEWPPKTGGDHTGGDGTTAGVSVQGQIGYWNDRKGEHSFGSSQKPPYQMQQPSRLWDGSGNASYQGGEWPPKTGGDHTSGDDTTGVSVHGQIGYQNDHEREHSFGSSQKPPYQMQQPSRLWDGSGNGSYQGGEWPPKTGGNHTGGDGTTAGVSVQGRIGYWNDRKGENSFGSSQKPPYQMQQPSRLWDGSGNASYQGGEWPPKTGGDHTSGDDTTGVSVHGQIGYQNDHEREHSFGSSQKPPYQMQQPSRLWDGSGNASYQGGEWPPKTGGNHTGGDDTTGVSVQGRIGYWNDRKGENSFGSSQKPPYQMQQPSRLWDGSGNASYQGGEWPPKTGGDHTSGDDTTGVSVHGQIGYQNDHEREHSFGSSQKPPYQMQQPSRLWDGSGNASYQGGEWPPKTGGDHIGGNGTTAGVSVHGQIGYRNQHYHSSVQQPSRLMHGTTRASDQGHSTELLLFYNELQDVAPKWNELGFQLEMRKNVLEVIKKDFTETKERFLEMLNRWLSKSRKSTVGKWCTIVKALLRLDEDGLAAKVAQNQDLTPRITRQPKSQNAHWRGTVTFWCEASTSGGDISYQWLRGAENMPKESRSRLTIKDVKKCHRGEYKCVVTSDFGTAESQPARLMIGVPFTKDTLRELLKKVGIKATDWPEIGRKLLDSQHLVDAFVRGIFGRIQEFPHDRTKVSWDKLAQTLEGMEGCQDAAQKAKENAGKELNKETLVGIFLEVGIKDPDWYRIGEECGLRLKKSWETFEDDRKKKKDEGTKNRSQTRDSEVTQPLDAILHDSSITWEKLAQALDRIETEGYDSAAERARKKAGIKMSQDSMHAVFRELDASTVDWHHVAKNSQGFNGSCLIEVLLVWHDQQHDKDPWKIWRKLAALIETIKDDDPNQLKDDDPQDDDHKPIPEQVKVQLGIGYELRLQSGVGLELNYETMFKVLKEAGIKDCSEIASGLVVDQGWIVKTWTRLKQVFVKGDLKEMLKKWPEPRSWEELARVIENLRDSFEIAQKTRQLSESGGCPKVKYFYTPELKENNVPSATTVTFVCEARGAAPMKYEWMCDGIVLKVTAYSRVDIDVRTSGKYSCHVENELGSDTSDRIKLGVGDKPTCTVEAVHTHIAVGKNLSLHCQASGTEPRYLTWFHNGEPVPPEKCQGSDLTIAQVTEDDQGKYECRVVNLFGKHVSYVEIEVGEPPVIQSFGIKGPKRIHHETGTTLNFYCEASGKSLQYIWLHNGMDYATGSHWKVLEVTATARTEGKYECQVKNPFGETKSEPMEIKVGGRPVIKGPPQKEGKVVPGGRVQLTCKVAGKGPFKCVWLYKNQTLVKETNFNLTIERMTEARQGKYKCQVTNAYGPAESKPVTLELEITQEGLMKLLQHDVQICRRWYMFGILLEVAKSVLDRISRGFAANGNANYSLQEVIGSWLEDAHNLTETEPTKPRNWMTVRDIVRKMGSEQLARDLGDKPEIDAPLEVHVLGKEIALGGEITLTCKATGRPPLSYTWLCNDDPVSSDASHPEFTIKSMSDSDKGEYKCKVSNEVGFTTSEPVTLTPGSQWETRTTTHKQVEEHANYSANDMSRMFDDLAGKMEEILSNPDPSDTEVTEQDTTAWVTESDEAVSQIQAYLQLIRFNEEDIEQIKDLPSVFKFLCQYWNYQRCHLLKKVVDQFNSEKAQTEMQRFLDHFKEYQTTTKLGYFAPAAQAEAPRAEPAEGLPEDTNPAHETLEGAPSKIAPFMKTFKVKLQCAWADCTLWDADNLLENLLPNTVSREFVWFSRAYRAEENSVCLEYVISPSVSKVLQHEMEMKKENMPLSSMGIIGVQVDGLEIEQMSSKARHSYAYEANPLESHGQLVTELLKETLAEFKDNISTQASVIKALEDRVQKSEKQLAEATVEREKQGLDIVTLQQRLQESEEKLVKASNESERHGSDIETLQEHVQKSENELAKASAERLKQGSDIETLQHEREKQGSDIGSLHEQLQETKNELDKRLKALNVKVRNDKEAQAKWNRQSNQTMKGEVKQEVTEHVDRLKKSVIQRHEEKLDSLPVQMRIARRKELSDLEERVKADGTKLKVQVKSSSQSTEENKRSLVKLSSDIDRKLKEQKHDEEKLRESEMTAHQKVVENKLQEHKHSLQELKAKVSGIETKLGFEPRLDRVERKIDELIRLK